MVLFPPLHVGHPLGLVLRLLWRLGRALAPVSARCGGGAAAWVTVSLAAPDIQGSWWLRAAGNITL